MQIENKYILSDTPTKITIGDRRAYLEVKRGKDVVFTLSDTEPTKDVYFHIDITKTFPSGTVVWCWTKDGSRAEVDVVEYDVTGGGGGGGDISLEDAFGVPL